MIRNLGCVSSLCLSTSQFSPLSGEVFDLYPTPLLGNFRYTRHLLGENLKLPNHCGSVALTLLLHRSSSRDCAAYQFIPPKNHRIRIFKGLRLLHTRVPGYPLNPVTNGVKLRDGNDFEFWLIVIHS